MPPVSRSSTTAHLRRAGRARPLLPGWRALVGALLVTVAMVGAWAAGAPRSRPSGRPYLVARRDLQPGHALTTADVRVVRLALPASVAGHVLAPGRASTGAVLLGPVHAGDPIASSLVVPARQVPDSHQVSFAIDRPWALDGALVVGERIDLLVTYGQGLDSQTRRVLRAVPVVALHEGGGGGLGDTATQTITVAITEADAVLAAVNAVRAGTVTVVRSTGSPPGDAGGSTSGDRYQPPDGVGPSDGATASSARAAEPSGAGGS